MPQVSSSEPCVICGVSQPIMHSHHTVPQCRGGKDSHQVILCPTHHNTIHAQALHIVSHIKNPKKEKSQKNFWESERLEQKASPLVRLIVEAFISTDTVNRTHIVSAELNTADFQAFKLLANDLHLSQEATLRWAIKLAVKTRGLDNAKNDKGLWFLPSSGKGKNV